MKQSILIALIAFLGIAPVRAVQKSTLKGKNVPLKDKIESSFIPALKEEAGKKATAVRIKGIILDKKTRERLAGVTLILNDNPSVGTITDMDGVFQITAERGSKLKVSYIGYETQLITVDHTDEMKVELDQDNFKLDEVVVTGQGAEVQKRRLSSNVTTVNSKELERMKQGRIDQILQNALPNVQITMASGQAGATSLVKSRGLSSAYSNSTPVIYVDGVRVDNMNTGATLNNSLSGNSAVTGSIGDIPMENIDHIEYVTGGAATTLYGSDAANGVIQIFTKKGANQKTTFFAETQLEADVASSQFYHFKRTKELLHQTGFTQKYRIGFDGGTEKYGYSFGASMSNSTGTLIENGNEDRKYDLRFGSRMKFNKYFEYQNSFGMVIQDFSRSRNGNQGGYTGLWFAEGAASTNFKYTDAEGNLVNYGADLDALDDYAFAQMKAFVTKAEALQNNRESIKRFQTSQSLSYAPLSNLTFKGVLGVDYRLNNNKNIITNEYLIHTQQKPEGTSDAGSISNFDRNYFGLTIDLNGQHKYRYKDIFSLISTAGFQFFSTYDHQSVYNGSNVRDGAQIVAGAGTLTSNEWLSYLYNYGYFIQENIGFLDRYYIDLGLRSDYNTAFGDNVGWQYYPKIGFSYVLSEEPFMQKLKESGMLSSLRILANYGVAGSYPPAFEYQRTVDFNSFLGQQAASFGKYGNPDLAPEKKHSYEAGFNAVLFNRILNLGFTYYYALTKDALFSIPSLPSSGQSANYLSNVGEIENKGIELSVGLQLVDTKDWNVRLNASYNTNHNKVLSIGTAVPFAIGGFSSRTVQTVVAKGEPVGFIRGYKAVLNPDNSLKEVLPLQNLGSTLPTGYGNFSLNASYKNLSLTVSGDYQYGAYVHSFDRQFRFSKGLKDNAIPEKALEGLDQGANWLNFTNFFVEKSDFVKIRNIGLSYDYKPKKYLKNINLGFNVYNPFSFTASSVDPEAALAGARSQGAVAVGGLNYSSYSTPRQYVGTIRISF
ncbi:TonB-dependent receptor domain-containing protein [Bacteroides gallinarum]|uniref:TonB-dependent receptor domain-containing protein n=1 Tax=Bacteroides gallinarum TaxID=376806 RepID=UPI00038073FC|nr:TonB-dependent receptor [Bacteroides gallinarum]